MAAKTTARDALLLVDDEVSILKALGRELADWMEEKGLELLTATSAIEALRILEMEGARTALVVSDLRMPGMLGSDFLIKVHELHPRIVTIMLTGYSEMPEIVKAVNAGIYSFILKPWESDYLRNELEKALSFQLIRKENERYRQILVSELRWAGELQRAMMTPSGGETEGVDFQVTYEPVTGLYVSGDYYDIIKVGDGRYLLLLGDVSGHGVRAALITAVLKAVIYHEYVQQRRDGPFSPAEFLGWLRDRLASEFRHAEDLILTFFCAYIDTGARSITWANAGSPKPFIAGPGGLLRLDPTGPAIGLPSQVPYMEYREACGPGSVLFAYSDGLVEIQPAGPSKGATLSASLLEELVGAYAGKEGFHQTLMESMLKAANATVFSDDVTIISARLA
jgi:sigma-B regulation protein RsbU (phosphoserine phosphatase)